VNNEELFLRAFGRAKMRCHIMNHEIEKMAPFERLSYLVAIQVWSESMVKNQSDSPQLQQQSVELLKHIRGLFDQRIAAYHD